MGLEEDFQDYLKNLMMKLTDLFCRKTKQLERELEETKAALAQCNEKLIEKQEHINTTNAYWKKKMREINSKKKKDL